MAARAARVSLVEASAACLPARRASDLKSSVSRGGERFVRLSARERVRQSAYEKFTAIGDGLAHPFEVLRLYVLEEV